MRGAGGVDRLLDVLGAAFAHVRQDVSLAMRHDRLEGFVGRDVFAADEERDRDAIAFHVSEAVLQLLALGRAGGI